MPVYSLLLLVGAGCVQGDGGSYTSARVKKIESRRDGLNVWKIYYVRGGERGYIIEVSREKPKVYIKDVNGDGYHDLVVDTRNGSRGIYYGSPISHGEGFRYNPNR